MQYLLRPRHFLPYDFYQATNVAAESADDVQCKKEASLRKIPKFTTLLCKPDEDSLRSSVYYLFPTGGSSNLINRDEGKQSTLCGQISIKVIGWNSFDETSSYHRTFIACLRRDSIVVANTILYPLFLKGLFENLAISRITDDEFCFTSIGFLKRVLVHLKQP